MIVVRERQAEALLERDEELARRDEQADKKALVSRAEEKRRRKLEADLEKTRVRQMEKHLQRDLAMRQERLELTERDMADLRKAKD
jgi:hypothetical protein